jgi:hypothetical protein
MAQCCGKGHGEDKRNCPALPAKNLGVEICTSWEVLFHVSSLSALFLHLQSRSKSIVPSLHCQTEKLRTRQANRTQKARPPRMDKPSDKCKHGHPQTQSKTTTTEPIPTHKTPEWRAYTFQLSDRCLATTASHSTLFSLTIVAVALGSIAAAPGSIAAIPEPIGLFLVSLPVFNREVRVVESGSTRFSS